MVVTKNVSTASIPTFERHPPLFGLSDADDDDTPWDAHNSFLSFTRKPRDMAHMLTKIYGAL